MHMRRRSTAFVSIGLWLLSACQDLPLLASSPTGLVSPSPSPTTYVEADASANSETGPSTGCYYVWSTRELPNLGARLRDHLAESARNLEAGAYAFGEECRSDSGETTFLAMETDFRIRVPVDTLENEAAMGNALQDAMAAIEALPDEEIAGTRPGRVEFEFVAGDSQSLRLNVDISRFRQEAAGLEGGALFRYFNAAP